MKYFIFLAASLTFLLSAAANAQSLSTCKGSNLMSELQRSKPDDYKAVMKEGGGELNGKALLWKITKDGGQPSYLFGTMHVSDPRLLELPEKVANALDSANLIAVENTDVMDEAALAGKISELAHLMVFTDGSNLNSHMSSKDQEALRQAAELIQVPYANIVNLRPWLVATMLALPSCETRRQAGGELFLDKAIVKRASQRGVEVTSLETLAEQLGAMSSLPMETQLAFLSSSARLAAQAEDFLETMIALYLDREIGTIPAMSVYFSNSGDAEKAAYVKFQEELVDKRNLVMLARSLPLLEKASVFIAVGALHLIGEKGLVELFRAEGYTVRAVW